MDNRRSAFQTLQNIGIEATDKLKSAIGRYMNLYSDADTDLYRRRGKERLRQLAFGVVFGVVALLFSSAKTAMGSYPLGIALYMAAAANSPYAYAGLATNALFSQDYGVALFIFVTLCMIGRVLYAKIGTKNGEASTAFREKLPVRMLFSAGMAAGAGLIRMIGGGFLYYDMLGALFGVMVAPLACLLYKLAFDRLVKRVDFTDSLSFGGDTKSREAEFVISMRESGFDVLYEAGLVALAFSAVWSLRPFEPFGFSLSIVAALILSLYISKEGGILRGGVYGLVIGLACAPLYAPVFGLAGIVSGLFWRFNRMVAISSAAVTGIAFGIYADGLDALTGFVPDIIAGAVIFAPFALLGLLPKLGLFAPSVEDGVNIAGENAVYRRRERSTLLKLEAVSEAFASLAEVVGTLSERLRKPGLYETRALITECFEERCSDCAMSAICQRRDYSQTLSVYDSLTRTAVKGGVVTRADVPDFLIQRCHDIDKIIAEINVECADLSAKTLKNDKTAIFAEDYESMARIIEECSEDDRYELDAELTERARGALRYLDFAAASVSVYGGRRVTVIAGGVDLSAVKMSADELQRCFENLTGTSLTSPQFAIDCDYVTMSMCSRRIFSAQLYTASSIKDDERVNGDHTVKFESGDDRFYTLISDGMGSGREAALTSRVTAVFLEKLISAGVEKPVALDMLGTFLRAKNCECFATVDMLEIDLLDGSAGFTKSGAAPSYILRGSDLFRIASNTMPVGITRCLNAEEVKFQLEDGDTIIMVSDGVTGTLEDGAWLCELLTYDRDDDLDRLTRKILTAAKAQNARSDDMTAAAIKIRKL